MSLKQQIADQRAAKRAVALGAAPAVSPAASRPDAGAGEVELRGVWVPSELVEQARRAVAELVEQSRERK